MTLTHSQLGETPKSVVVSLLSSQSCAPKKKSSRRRAKLEHRKTEHPGFIETPTRRTRSARLSKVQDANNNDKTEEDSPSGSLSRSKSTPKSSLGQANGHVNGDAVRQIRDKPEENVKERKGKAESPEFEFGGPWGVGAMMVGFPLVMYYMWIGATFYDGHFPRPERGQGFVDFFLYQASLVYNGAFPGLKAWSIYWVFLAVEAIFYLYLPGITLYGKPLKHLGGKRLEYYCSGMWSFYTTIAMAMLLHVTGLFTLYTIMDEFGPIMSVAIISGFLASFTLYVSALYRGVTIRMTGNHVYDFFMGAELNPRLFGLFDFKMFFEVRLPWFILFLLTLGTAARQYEQHGYVSGEVGFMLMAHFLYANACAKAEEAIVTTW